MHCACVCVDRASFIHITQPSQVKQEAMHTTQHTDPIPPQPRRMDGWMDGEKPAWKAIEKNRRGRRQEGKLLSRERGREIESESE
mmetsp:Transcript_5505/g.13036  ORF Transcript_5505/g.13036 Transcript_5505/m.13036 type:complete len:85 (+) Transcript_5505:2438-2692(+)